MPQINIHQRVMLQNWCANVDLQVFIDVEACAKYLAKYVTKGEPTSMSAYAIFASCVAKLSDNDNHLTTLQSLMLHVVGERDFSAQETAHAHVDGYLFIVVHTVLYASCLIVAVPFRLRQLVKVMNNQHSDLQKNYLCLTAMLITVSMTAAFRTLQYSIHAHLWLRTQSIMANFNVQQK